MQLYVAGSRVGIKACSPGASALALAVPSWAGLADATIIGLLADLTKIERLQRISGTRAVARSML